MFPVAALLLASTLYAGVEVPVAAEVRDAQPYIQVLDDAAAGPEKALVVWHENDLLRGVRVDRDGATLDPVPLLIAHAPGDDAKVARGATNWLVVWTSGDRVEARIVGDDGTTGPVIVMPTEDGIFPRVAFNGNQYLVAWYDHRTGLHATRVGASGQVLESGIQLAPHEPIVLRGLFPLAGGGFLLVAHRTELLALTLDAQAREVSRRTVLPAIPWHAPALALDSNGRLIAGWPAGEAAYVQREGAEAVALEAEQVEGFVTAGGTMYAVARGDGKTALWTLDGTFVRELSSTDGLARVVSMGNRVLAAGGDQDVLVTLLDASLQTIVPEHLAYAEPALQAAVAVAQARDTRLIAWTETDTRTYRVMARLGDGTPFVVADGAFPQVATDGRDFLVTWQSGFYLAYRRVSRDGSLGPVAFADGWLATGRSCATWNGSEYIIGYATLTHPRVQVRSIAAQRVTREGERSGDPALVPTPEPLGVACASTNATTLLAWFDVSRNVTGAILSPGGTMSAEFAIGRGTGPSVAAHGDGFVVAWASGWTTVSEGGTVGTPHELPGMLVRVASRPGGYLLMYGRDPLRVRPLDAAGNFSGPELALPGAERPAFAGGLLVYERNTDAVLPQPRWRVFMRELTASTRRRAIGR